MMCKASGITGSRKTTNKNEKKQSVLLGRDGLLFLYLMADLYQVFNIFLPNSVLLGSYIR